MGWGAINNDVAWQRADRGAERMGHGRAVVAHRKSYHLPPPRSRCSIAYPVGVDWIDSLRATSATVPQSRRAVPIVQAKIASAAV